MKKNLAKADTYLEQGNLAEAKKILTEALKNCEKSNNLPFVYFKLAHIAMLEDDEVGAVYYYMDLVKERPEYLETLILLADTYMNSQKYDLALDMYKRIKEMRANNLHVDLNLLRCKVNSINDEDNENAKKLIEEEYKNFANQHQQDAKVNYETANYFAHTGDIDTAYEYCQRALNTLQEAQSLQTDNIEPIKLMGLLLLIKGNVEDAKIYLNKALKYDKKNAEVINLISYIVCNGETYDEFYESKEKYLAMIHKMLNIS